MIKENRIVKTAKHNYYYLYLLNDKIVGFNIIKRNIKYSKHLDDIIKEHIITYWSSGVYHSILQLVKLPKQIFIYLLEHDKRHRRLSWVRHDIEGEIK